MRTISWRAPDCEGPRKAGNPCRGRVVNLLSLWPPRVRYLPMYKMHKVARISVAFLVSALVFRFTFNATDTLLATATEIFKRHANYLLASR
jgi:hypothetical protein